MKLPFHRELKCCVRRLEYDFVRKQGVIVLEKHHCCGMDGCVQLFESLDPDEVLRIYVFSDTALDIIYEREEGEWTAKDTRDRGRWLWHAIDEKQLLEGSNDLQLVKRERPLGYG